jgi:hypothetical protein
MEMQLHGTIDGKRIELEEETGLPDGSAVLVQIQLTDNDLETRRRMIEALCGAWADDPSLPGIFAEIERQRDQAGSRNIDFDAPS